MEAFALQADVGLLADCNHLVSQAITVLGGLDVIISNAGWTKFGPWEDLYALSESDWDQCWAVNVKAQMHLLRAALANFSMNKDGGVFLITSSSAGTVTEGSSMAYSVTKAAGLHLTRCLAQTLGPKMRVNAVCPGLMLTEWGAKYPVEKIEVMENKAVLKKTTDMDDCANTFVWLAKNESITGQKVIVGKWF